MLPRKIPKKGNRTARWKSQAHCNFVRGHHCCVPRCEEMPIEVAHVRCGSDAGMGRKPSDWHTISLCREHHAQQHAIGEGSFEDLYSIDMAELAEEFAKASPKWREIQEARRNAA